MLIERGPSRARPLPRRRSRRCCSTPRAARAAFRLDPNEATAAQFERLSRLEGAAAGPFETVRPFFALSELEAAAEVPATDLAELFREPSFELAGTAMPDQALTPLPELGLVVLGESAPDVERLQALGFAVETPEGEPPRSILRPGPTVGPAARNVAKTWVGGRIVPALRDEDGLARWFLLGHADVWFAPGTTCAGAEAALAAAGLRIRSWNEEGGLAAARLAERPPGGEPGGAGQAMRLASSRAPYRFDWGTSYAAPVVAGGAGSRCS